MLSTQTCILIGCRLIATKCRHSFLSLQNLHHWIQPINTKGIRNPFPELKRSKASHWNPSTINANTRRCTSSVLRSNFFFTVWCLIKQRYGINFLLTIFIWNELSPATDKIGNDPSRNQPQANPQCNLPPLFFAHPQFLYYQACTEIPLDVCLRRWSPSHTIGPSDHFFFLGFIITSSSLCIPPIAVPLPHFAPLRLNTDFHSFPIPRSQA